MARFGVVARFYVDIPVADRDEAERVLRSKLEAIGCTYLRKPGAIQALRVTAREPLPQSESKAERRERYQKRKAEREKARE